MIVDILMTAALLFLMGYQFWGDAAHEWAGAVMFVLFILHHILNRGWYRALPKGRYSPARVFQFVINLLLLLVMMGQMVSGIILSRCVFSFLPISGGMSFARLLHMAAAYWGFVLMALHLGLHWNMVSGRLGKVLGHSRSSRWRTIAGRTAGIVLAVYGLSHLSAEIYRTICFFGHSSYYGFQRTGRSILPGLSGHDGIFHFCRPLSFQRNEAGLKRFALYLAYVILFSLASGLLVALII